MAGEGVADEARGGVRPRAKGWAVVEGGELTVATVASDHRGALNRWLKLRGYAVAPEVYSDDDAEIMWRSRRERWGADLMPVSVEPLHQVPAFVGIGHQANDRRLAAGDAAADRAYQDDIRRG